MVMFGAERAENGCLIGRFLGDKDGYGLVKIPGIKVKVGAHRISYQENVGPIPSGMSVCHSCDTPACIEPGHFFLGTHGDNKSDSVRKRRHAFGAKHPNAKLSEDQVTIIVNARGRREKIAARFGISVATVSEIRSGKSWKHLDEPRPI